MEELSSETIRSDVSTPAGTITDEDSQGELEETKISKRSLDDAKLANIDAETLQVDQDVINKFNDRLSAGTFTQTQLVPELTASQLHEVMGLSVISSDPPQTVHSSSRIDSNREEEFPSPLVDETNDAIDDTRDAEEEHISSSDSENSEADTTPTFVSQYRQIQVIDETPLKQVIFASPNTKYVFLLCKWSSNASWWPCRALRKDWEEQADKAVVLFRNDEEASLDLKSQQTAIEFDLRVGDLVHLYGHKPKNRRFEVMQLSKPSGTDSIISTGSGCTEVSLRYRNQPVSDHPVSDIYLTANDMKLWKAARALNAAIPRAAIPSDTSSPSLRSIRPSTPLLRTGTDSVSPRKSSPRRIQKLRGMNTALYTNGPNEGILTNVSLFKDCVFSISSSKSIKSILKLIENHGGQVLENGLSDVVELQIDKYDPKNASRSQSITNSMIDAHSGMFNHTQRGVRLNCDFGNKRLAFVLAVSPRRTLKYLELIALGWPCISISYIQDCIENKTLLDWTQYVLPAGSLTLESRKHDVSADYSTFHRQWLLGFTLNDQFWRRRVILQCFCPIYILRKQPAAINSAMYKSEEELEDADASRLLLLVALSSPIGTVHVANNKREIPHGSLVIDLNSQAQAVTKSSNAAVKFNMMRYSSLPETITHNVYWLAQCIINGGIV